MSPISLHLLSCHVPLVGGVFVLGLLVAGMRREDRSLLSAADIATLAVTAFCAVAWATGPAARAALGPWLDPAGGAFADRHSTLGELSMIAWGLAGAFALWGIFLRDAPHPAWRRPVVLGLVLIGLGSAGWAGYEGGRIRHEEIRPGVDNMAELDS